MAPPKFLSCVLSRKPCPACKGTIEVGEDVWPSKSGYIHAACALDLEARGELVLQPPACKHWERRGACALYEEGRCFFSHPPLPPAAQPQPKPRQNRGTGQRMMIAPKLLHVAGVPSEAGCKASGTGSVGGGSQGQEELSAGQVTCTVGLDSCSEVAGAAAAEGAATPLPGLEAATRRNRSRPRVRNRFRVSVFRSWLLDTFGADYLSRGSGVLDVAGGKGELAFELLNLNGVPASVLDPRPMQLEQYEKRLKEGFYHFSRVFERYNGMTAAAAASMAALDSEAAAGGAEEPCCNSSLHGECAGGASDGGRRRWLPREPRTPGHVRIFLTDQVVESIGQLAALRYDGCDAAGSPNSPEWEAALADATTAVLESRRRAKQVEWTRKGFAAAEGHEEEPTRVLPAGHWRQRLTAAVGQRWRRCHISGGQRARQAEEEADEEAVDDRGEEAEQSPDSECGMALGGDEPCSKQTALLPPQQPESAAEAADTAGPQAALADQGAGTEAAVEGDAELETEAEARAWAEGAIRCLMDCSVVAAMHPDQAAEFAVRLALAAGKPFALVPCCVYAAEFPRRKLQSGDQVRSYTQLLAYLQELGAAGGRDVVAQELPFEGKNVLLYSRTDFGPQLELKSSDCNPVTMLNGTDPRTNIPGFARTAGDRRPS